MGVLSLLPTPTSTYSFYHMGPGAQIQVVRLGGGFLYPLSHLGSPVTALSSILPIEWRLLEDKDLPALSASTDTGTSVTSHLGKKGGRGKDS